MNRIMQIIGAESSSFGVAMVTK